MYDYETDVLSARMCDIEKNRDKLEAPRSRREQLPKRTQRDTVPSDVLLCQWRRRIRPSYKFAFVFLLWADNLSYCF